eukprot:g26121.t1
MVVNAQKHKNSPENWFPRRARVPQHCVAEQKLEILSVKVALRLTEVIYLVCFFRCLNYCKIRVCTKTRKRKSYISSWEKSKFCSFFSLLDMHAIAFFVGSALPTNFNMAAQLHEPLYYAACSGNEEECIRLLDDGANPSWQNPGFLNETPLMEAAWRKHLGVAKLLLSRGARVNAQNIYGNSALILAAYHGNYELVELLLEYGADPLMKSNSGKNALYWAKAYGKRSCVEALETYMNRNAEVFKELQELGALPRVLNDVIAEYSAPSYTKKVTRRDLKRQPSTSLTSASSSILRNESSNKPFTSFQTTFDRILRNLYLGAANEKLRNGY